MNDELKSWIITIIKGDNPGKLTTNELFAISAFGEFSDDNQPLDIHLQYRSNNAELYSEIEDFQRSISLENNKWDEAKLVKLVGDIMSHLKNGGRYRLVGEQFKRL